jgi:hypothetical protein
MKRMIGVALLLVAGPLLRANETVATSRRHGFQTVNQISRACGRAAADQRHLAGLPKVRRCRCCRQARKILESRLSKDDPQANCLPSGVPRIAPYPWRIVQTPTHIFFLFEGQHPQLSADLHWMVGSIPPIRSDVVRPLDRAIRRKHADRGHRRLNDKFWFDFKGHPHTEQLHIVERYTRRDFNTLVNQITIDGSGAYSRPFTVTFTAELRTARRRVARIHLPGKQPGRRTHCTDRRSPAATRIARSARSRPLSPTRLSAASREVRR